VEQNRVASRGQVIVMAAVAGVTIANIYYSQPILANIAASIHASSAQIGNLPVLTQAGYGLGLFLLTPLGDMIDRKKLVVVLESLLCVALIAITRTTSLAGLYVTSFLIGVLAVSVQIIMPMAAALATQETKGRVVGMVFTGALTGILSARIMSGYIAEWLGWRWVYGISACLVLIAASIVARVLPALPSHHKGSYGGLLRSTLHQLGRFPLLRRASLLGALVFGAFCSFWTTLTFHLSGSPFNYRSDEIGLFGILAIAGALAAPVFGHLADKRNSALTQYLTIGLIIVSVLCIQWRPDSVLAFMLATVLLDIGVQATQVSSLAQIYALDEAAHSRINTVFVTTLFIGGAIGTYAGVLSWSVGGWGLVCWQLLLWSVLALAVAFWR
jgi:predicted MFS family arabinose efflux permease